MDKLTINHWAEEDRPREKLMSLGPEALSNAELLAILIGSGSPEESAVDLMKHIMNTIDCRNHQVSFIDQSIIESSDIGSFEIGYSRSSKIGLNKLSVYIFVVLKCVLFKPSFYFYP